MLNIKARLHMQNHSEPHGRAYIIGDKQGLKALGEALLKTSKSVIGLDTIKLYTSDGHEYEIIIACDVSEEEWQQLPVPYNKHHDPTKLEIVKSYNDIKSTY